MQLLISKCSQANGKWTDQFRELGMGDEGDGEKILLLTPNS